MKLLSLFVLFFSLQVSAAEILDLGTYRAEKYGNTEVINIYRQGLVEIRIINIEDVTTIERATLYADRNVENLYGLQRDLHGSDVAVTRTNPRAFINTLELSVHSSLRGSRGRFRVEAVVDSFGPPPPPPPPPGGGSYDPAEARQVYYQIVNFASDRMGLGHIRPTGESMAREWTRRGRICGSSWEIENMTRDFYRRADYYRRQRYYDRDARQYALRDVSYQSRCSDILYVY
ncbi:MAG: hypothetical protein KDD37_05115 [Bdellovibrionales bacterium]|nr:hypothetical protein [Bdellovibrionales bacterium]